MSKLLSTGYQTNVLDKVNVRPRFQKIHYITIYRDLAKYREPQTAFHPLETPNAHVKVTF